MYVCKGCYAILQQVVETGCFSTVHLRLIDHCGLNQIYAYVRRSV